MSFDPAKIMPDPRHAYGPTARLSIIDTVQLLQPQLTRREAWGAWTAFQQSKGLPRPPRAFIPGRAQMSEKQRRVASTLVADLDTQAALVMSLPGDTAHLKRCAEDLLSHFGGDPSLVQQLPHTPLTPLLSWQPVSDFKPSYPPSNQNAATKAVYQIVEELCPEVVDSCMVFQGDAFSLRGLLDSKGELWLKGMEVATALGQTRQALRENIDSDKRAKLKDLVNANPDLSLAACLANAELEEVWLRESGVWQLLGVTRTKEAKAFDSWWSGEVVPRLRHLAAHGALASKTPEASEDHKGTLHEKVQLDLLRAQLVGERLDNKKRRLEVAVLARTAASECGLPVTSEQLQFERLALTIACQDAELPEDRKIDANDYLRLRGHSDDEIRSLQVSFGKLLKKAYFQARGALPQTFTVDFGKHEGAVCCYDRCADRALLNAAYQAMTFTTLYKHAVPQEHLALNSI